MDRNRCVTFLCTSRPFSSIMLLARGRPQSLRYCKLHSDNNDPQEITLSVQHFSRVLARQLPLITTRSFIKDPSYSSIKSILVYRKFNDYRFEGLSKEFLSMDYRRRRIKRSLRCTRIVYR